MKEDLRGKACIVGVAESDLGEVGPGVTPLDLQAQALERALDEAGLRKSDVDGLFSASVYYQMASVEVGEYLGIRPRYTDSTTVGGCSFIVHLHHAAVALQAGACDVAVILYASVQRSGGGGFTTNANPLAYERPYEPRMPISMYAMSAARHMHQYGTTREQLAEVAVQTRQWAGMNPKAFMREPLSVADVVGARLISEPFTLLDCCVVTDGGGAVIVTRPDRARDLRQKPVYLLGAGEAHWHRHISQMPDLTVTAGVDSGRRAFEMAGVTPRDIDVCELYDAFTIFPIVHLEDLGFCEKGEGGAFVSGGRIGPGGACPVNTNGGGLSYCHPGMYGIFTIIEATRQLRGECGPRQIDGARIALAHGVGGVWSAAATSVLGTADVL
jgi:acetyl-CoA acetyltransferase